MNIALFQLNTCDLGLLPLLLGTLIPFLLGLLLGWLIWSKWRKMYEDMVSKYEKLTDEFNRVTAEKEDWERKHDDVSSLLRTSKMDANRLGHEVDEHKDTISTLRDKVAQLERDANI